MIQYLTAYIATMLTFFAIDFVWLSYVANKFYRDQMGHLMLEDVKIPIAMAFYLIYGVGIVIFAVAPALNNGGWKHALLYGALFGFFCYSAYDLTNMATLKDWPMKMSFVDMAWGTFLTGTSALGGFWITSKLLGL